MQKFYELTAEIMPEDIAEVTIDRETYEMPFAEYLDLRERYPSIFFSPIIQVIKSASSEVKVLK